MNTILLNQSSVPRWVGVLPFAMALTLALLALMNYLIFREYEEVEVPPEIVIPDVNWEIKVIEEIVETKVKKPEPPRKPPDVPEPEKIESGNPNMALPKTKFVHKPPTDFGGGIHSRMPVAQVLISPKYPSRAITRGVEGFVDVRFDISAEGITQNIEVTYAEPENIFDKAAIDAVKHWRYLPQLDNGKPIPFIGLVQRIRFEMQK